MQSLLRRSYGVNPWDWTIEIIKTESPAGRVRIRIRLAGCSQALSEATLRCRPLQ